MQEKTKQLATKPAKEKKALVAVVKTETAALLEMAVNKNLDIDKLEKLIKLRNEEQAQFCRREFQNHFSLMQREFTAVKKSKSVSDDHGKKLYDYSPLDQIQKMAGEILSRHGFNYRWNEELLATEDGRVTNRVWFILSGYGHEERNYCDGPLVPKTRAMNDLQQKVATNTYLRRYSMIFGLGLVIKGADTDGCDVKPQKESDQRPVTPEKPDPAMKAKLAMNDLYGKMKKSNCYSEDELKKILKDGRALEGDLEKLTAFIDDWTIEYEGRIKE